MKESIIMNRSLALASCAAFSFIIVSGFVAKTDRAVAQQSDKPSAEVEVQAERIVRHEVGRSSSGIPIELIQLTRRVGYGDLDLKKHSDVTELEKRISATAEEACKTLADDYPLVAPNNPNCVKEATDGAMKQADVAIKMANK